MHISKKISSDSRIHLLIIAVAITLAYSNIFRNQFVWDDIDFVVNWQATRDLAANWQNLIMGELPERQVGLYRPIRSIYYALAYALWGTNLWGYHLFSIFLKIAASLLVYGITLKLTKDNILAFCVGLLFGLHPVHVEAITWITANFDIAGVVTLLGAFYCYLLYKEKQQKNWLLASLGLATLSYFTNEVTLIFPGIIASYEITIGKKDWNDIKSILQSSVPFLVPALVFLYIRVGIMGISGREQYIYNSLVSSSLVMSVAAVKYATLLFFPHPLTINQTILPGYTAFLHHDINPDALPLRPSLFQFPILASIAVLAAIIFWAYKNRHQKPIVVFGIAWFLLGILPLMQIVPQTIIFGERYVFLASFGLIISLVYYLQTMVLAQKPSEYNYLLIALVTISIGLGIRTFHRNKDWHTPQHLWTATLEHTPTSGYVKNGIAEYEYLLGNTDKALELLQEAYEGNPYNTLTKSNYATLLTEKGEYEKAIPLLEETVQQASKFHSAKEKLGLAYFLSGDYQKAIENYQLYAAIYPNNPLIHQQLGKSYQSAFMFGNAETSYKTALSLTQDNIDIHYALGNLYLDWGRYGDALEHYLLVKEALSDYPEIDTKIQQAQEGFDEKGNQYSAE